MHRQAAKYAVDPSLGGGEVVNFWLGKSPYSVQKEGKHMISCVLKQLFKIGPFIVPPVLS